jgi:hypothetical protein
MAFRIHESVVRGEIDNRIKGLVRGKIWLAGRAEPLTVELTGNPKKRLPDLDLDSLDSVQRGSIGDLTASRKVRVFDVPLAEADEMLRRGERPPEHMANCLYLEWFSEANGRVVIESTDYHIIISPPEWRMTLAEDEERAKQAADGMAGFMRRLTEAVEGYQRGQKDPDDQWDEHDYERFLKESDARTEKYGELLDKYGHSEEAEAKIASEMGWDGDPDQDGSEDDRLSVDEMNAICEAALNEPAPEPDAAREGIDWIRTENGELHHPLQHRCFESAGESDDKDLVQFVSEFQTTGAKLAGALNPIARGEGHCDAAFTVAYLKRALDHLHKSMAGLEAVRPKKLLPDSMMAEARTELFEIREGILRLMEEFRGQR